MKNRSLRVCLAFVAVAGAAVACSSSAPEEPTSDPATIGTVQQALPWSPRDLPSGPWSVPQGALSFTDTYVGEDTPSLNHGAEANLRVGSPGHDRAIIQGNYRRIQLPPITPGTIESATLTLTIAGTSEDWGPSGRALAVHRVTSEWAETEATWSCGTVTCPHNAWRMEKNNIKLHPYAETPTATAIITNGQTGTISFDVTADVAAFAAATDPAPNLGWVIRKVDESEAGIVDLGSRESETPPDLRVKGILTNVSPIIRSTHCAVGNNTPPCGSPQTIRCSSSCLFGRHPITGLPATGWAVTLTSAPYDCICYGLPPYIPFP